MAYDTDFIVRLIGASELIERRGNLEDALGGLAEMAAKLLSASMCSIMLLGDEEVADGMPYEPGLRVYAHYGALPQEAYAQFTRLNEGISGHVAATAEPLLIENIARSPFMSVARHAHDRPGSLVSTPIFLNDKVIGVFNVSSPLDERVFIRRDLDLLSIFALFVGKSIHVAQLQNVLRSRLMQVALALEEKGEGRYRL
ncbi:GAF domain-containing protein [Acidihalobacter yilgarnensis]|uniref:GAF domain-containing protein n=1 Tax=Acidihalobacter yilgarnensis TaxID=2819280 RepID=UPI0009F2F89D|nr:GAF domain-containing protein [Acidihalobacter yilgarnensis]